MPYGLYISADGAHTQQMRLEVIANNLANVDTPGFKRELAVFRARYAEAIDEGIMLPDTGAIEDAGGGVMVQQTVTDFSAGPLSNTKGLSDLAIEGEGFFVVQKDNEALLTRAGNFQLTAQGQLVTPDGHPVLNDAGAPVVINPTEAWEFTSNGGVRQAGTVQQLAIVRPESLNDLVHVGENLFHSLSEPQTIAVEDRRVLQGFLEGSGVDPTTEMTEMIIASRALEANVNLMKAQDDMLNGLVNRVMRVR